MEYVQVLIYNCVTSNMNASHSYHDTYVYYVPYAKLTTYVSRGEVVKLSVDNSMRGAVKYFGRTSADKAELTKTESEKKADAIIGIARASHVAGDHMSGNDDDFNEEDTLESGPLPRTVIAEIHIKQYLSM